MQLVLGNCTNLQLHVSHATKFQLHATVAKPKISSSVPILFNYFGFNLNFCFIQLEVEVLKFYDSIVLDLELIVKDFLGVVSLVSYIQEWR